MGSLSLILLETLTQRADIEDLSIPGAAEAFASPPFLGAERTTPTPGPALSASPLPMGGAVPPARGSL